MKYAGIAIVLFARLAVHKSQEIFSPLQPTFGERSIRGLTVPGEYRFASRLPRPRRSD